VNFRPSMTAAALLCPFYARDLSSNRKRLYPCCLDLSGLASSDKSGVG
jgi:hypothetical protein